MRTRRSLLAALAAGVLASTLTACSFSVGDLEEVGGDSATAGTESTQDAATDESTAGADSAGDAASGMQTIQASHITAQVPADWAPSADEDPWKYIHQKPNDQGGVAGRIAFMPGGKAMGAQESVEWFISQVEGTGSTDDNFAPINTLRTDGERANTSYTYQSGGEAYVAVVWGITDSQGAPSLIQLSGVESVMTQDFVSQVDQSLELTGDWQG
ncbi:hypothetical protein [Myceligenerans pegani]|uniref:Lipoprotein n=1 Tax=Myceligenerans pegani TaxID=2776917 RepID=A0ABR9N5C3_9MICO|nr:hypothetical protein [Myceligenerans sp. TRM 65318]MBE1878868.1 hypothetical protein [Myceligenerans sp. TRM 65318]MBE3021139.1 hypothetical protein [Myceligenerans sp. TRM 65318]